MCGEPGKASAAPPPLCAEKLDETGADASPVLEEARRCKAALRDALSSMFSLASFSRRRQDFSSAGGPTIWESLEKMSTDMLVWGCCVLDLCKNPNQKLLSFPISESKHAKLIGGKIQTKFQLHLPNSFVQNRTLEPHPNPNQPNEKLLPIPIHNPRLQNPA